MLQAASPLDQATFLRERAGSNETHAQVKYTLTPLPQLVLTQTEIQCTMQVMSCVQYCGSCQLEAACCYIM